MLRALFDCNIVPDIVVGCSVGALNGVQIAAHPAAETVAAMAERWSGLSRRGIFSGSVLTQFGTLVRHGTHLHSNQDLTRLLDDTIGDASFEDLVVRFECVAACIEQAAPHWFSSGPVAPAVLASCAVPGLLPPVQIGGLHYFDGGLVRSVPVGRAVQLGAQRLFVLHVGRLAEPLEPPRRPWQVALTAFEISRRHHFQEEVANLPDDVELHVLPTGLDSPALSVQYRKTSAIPQRIDAAYEASAQYLTRALL